VGDHSHSRTVAAYSEEVKKAEKKYNNLMDESKSLAKKKSQVEKDIEENNANIEKQAKEIEKRRELLKQVQSKN
jgi:predicted  nucleic acid-binding Zn-ribbon protein